MLYVLRTFTLNKMILVNKIADSPTKTKTVALLDSPKPLF